MQIAFYSMVVIYMMAVMVVAVIRLRSWMINCKHIYLAENDPKQFAEDLNHAQGTAKCLAIRLTI